MIIARMRGPQDRQRLVSQALGGGEIALGPRKRGEVADDFRNIRMPRAKQLLAQRAGRLELMPGFLQPAQ